MERNVSWHKHASAASLAAESYASDVPMYLGDDVSDGDWTDSEDGDSNEADCAATLEHEYSFLNLDEGFFYSGRVLDEAQMYATIILARRQLATILLNLSKPKSRTGVLAHTPAMQCINDRTAFIARDADRLHAEYSNGAGPKKVSRANSERAELITHQAGVPLPQLVLRQLILSLR